MGRRHLIAVDGSEQSQNAFDWYIENLHRQGDFILLFHCAEFNINMGMPGTHDVKVINEICDAIKKKEDEISSLTEGFMNVLRQRKIESKCVRVSGKPGEALCNTAKEEKADHIIMGTRGLGMIRRTLLGSVSEYVIHHSDVPVSIIRKPEAA